MSVKIIAVRGTAAVIAAGWVGAAIVSVLNPSTAHADDARIDSHGNYVRIDAQDEVRGNSTQADRRQGPAMWVYPARQGADPVVSIGADGTVRAADMSAYKVESPAAKPQTTHEAGDGLSCKRGETSGGPFNVGSERCQDLGR